MGKRVVEAAGLLLITRDLPQKFLLLQHPRRWDLPKGHIEAGEDILTAALRETEEETGIPTTSIEVDANFKYVVEYPVTGAKRGDYLKRVTYLLGYIPSTMPVTLTEHIGHKWFEWAFDEPIQARTIDPLLQSVRAYLKQLE
jgi:bis(5'-nucleosidyl)-tetraphosphatase